jgi:hypothetical protein
VLALQTLGADAPKASHEVAAALGVAEPWVVPPTLDAIGRCFA